MSGVTHCTAVPLNSPFMRFAFKTILESSHATA